MGKFELVCLECGREHRPLTLACEAGCNSLLRTRYREPAFRPAPASGIFKFLDWLPCEAGIETGIGPLIYPCEAYARAIGAEALFCAFNGYWPERGAHNPTGTFKDFEALPTLLALLDRGKRRIVLASAGNTARAFAHAAGLVDFTVYLVVPEKMLARLWLPGGAAAKGSVRLVAVRGSGDYSQAIQIADEISRRFAIDPEGGARNVARRDGLGTVMLEAGRALGRLPDHYFQAVGSGTGGIAAYESALRLAADERFRGQAPPRLHLSQNAPFLPIYQAWRSGGNAPPAPWPAATAEEEERLFASVLANRRPPYSIRGGVAEALRASGGEVYSVTSGEAIEAGRRFSRCEGIDLEPAAAVAVASLEQALAAGTVRRDELIVLNLTGGGSELIRRDLGVRAMVPDLLLDESSLDSFASLL